MSVNTFCQNYANNGSQILNNLHSENGNDSVVNGENGLDDQTIRLQNQTSDAEPNLLNILV